MTHTTQSDALRQTISGMLNEVGITAEELYAMLFGRGQDVEIATPELGLSTEALMSEGTWKNKQLGTSQLETLALHVDIRSALQAMDAGTLPETAEAMTALLGEEVIAESGELQVKRKFFDFQKGLKAFLAALSFMQLMKVAAALAAKTAPNLVPTFNEFKNRPQERKQLEHFVLTQISDPTPPALAALALAGLPMMVPNHAEGMEFAQPFKQFAIGLEPQKLEQVRARIETIVERDSPSQVNNTALPETNDARDKDKNKDGIPDKLQSQQQKQMRTGNPQPQQLQQQQQQSAQQQPEGATPGGQERQPKMSNMFGRVRGSGRREREAREKDMRDKEQAQTVTVKEEAATVMPGGKSESQAKSNTNFVQRLGMREYLRDRDRADGVVGNGINAPRPPQAPEEVPQQQNRPSKSTSTTKPAKTEPVKTDKVEKPASEKPAPTQAKMPENVPLEKVNLSAPPIPPAANPKMADLLPPEMLKGFSGLKAQEASADELGQTRSSLAKDDKLTAKVKPAPQIER